MGSYAETAPYDCPKTEKIMQDALERLLARDDWGKFGDKALALLATGEKKHVESVRDYIHAAPRGRSRTSRSVWSRVAWFVGGIGYHNLLLTEYYLATGDDYVLPAIREYAVKTAMGQSSGGTWGHGFAWTSKNDGRIHGHLGGYGAVNQAGLPCFLSLILAKKCGIEDPEIDAAIDRAAALLPELRRQGFDRLRVPPPEPRDQCQRQERDVGQRQERDRGGRLPDARGRPVATRFFARLTASLYNTCEYGHSGNSYSYFWDPLGANCAGPANVAAFLKELRWYYALTRKADGGFVYQPLGGIYGGGLLDPTAAQVLIGALCRARHSTSPAGRWTSRSGSAEGEVGGDHRGRSLAAGRSPPRGPATS